MDSPTGSTGIVPSHIGNHSSHLWAWLIAFLVVIIIVFIVVIMVTRSNKKCTNSDHCPAGEICSGGKCQPAGVQSCTNNTDCPSGQVCKNGVCIVQPSTSCTDTSQCPQGTYCDPITKTCQTQGGGGVVGSPCTKEGDCKQGLYCSGANTCQNNSTYNPRSCTSNVQCQVGNFCNSSGQCITNQSGGQTGQVCSQGNPCVTTDFCSSAQICQTGTPLPSGSPCTSLSQCGPINGIKYYCNINSSPGSPVCANSGFSYQIAPNFTNLFLLNNSTNGFLSVFIDGFGSSYLPYSVTLTVSGGVVNDPSSAVQLQYTPGTLTIAQTMGQNPFTGLIGIDQSGLLIAGVTTPGILYVMQLLNNNTTIGYVIIDQYGNPLLSQPGSWPNNILATNPNLGFYDPTHYPGRAFTSFDQPVIFTLVNYYN